jgi:D-glycero-D-manno-heptose 1,7-bisphosphate phosphatase
MLTSPWRLTERTELPERTDQCHEPGSDARDIDAIPAVIRTQPSRPTGPSTTMSQPAHFFDLGGTLVALDDHDDIAYDERGRVTILPGVRERLTALAGTPVFVVTNQAGIADGTLTAERFDTFCAQLSAATADAITAYAACTHPRDAGCGCRKPEPGLVLDLAETYHIDLTRSVMIGDTDTDRQLAAFAGIGRFIWANDYFRPT